MTEFASTRPATGGSASVSRIQRRQRPEHGRRTPPRDLGEGLTDVAETLPFLDALQRAQRGPEPTGSRDGDPPRPGAQLLQRSVQGNSEPAVQLRRIAVDPTVVSSQLTRVPPAAYVPSRDEDDDDDDDDAANAPSAPVAASPAAATASRLLYEEAQKIVERELSFEAPDSEWDTWLTGEREYRRTKLVNWILEAMQFPQEFAHVLRGRITDDVLTKLATRDTLVGSAAAFVAEFARFPEFSKSGRPELPEH